MNFFLETINGITVILLAFAFITLSLYLFDQKQRLHYTWRELISSDRPLGVRLALPMLTIKLGMLMTRGSIWGWREFGGGSYLSMFQRQTAVVGTVITALGVLWLIRVLSRYRLGDWPWIAAAATVLVYVVVHGTIHYGT